MEDSITGTDVWQEGISQALPLMCPFHQTSNVHHIQVGGNLTVNHQDQVMTRPWYCAIQGLDIDEYKIVLVPCHGLLHI